MPAIPTTAPRRGFRSSGRRSPSTSPTDRGIKAGPANVVVTPGAKPIMFYTMIALLDPGDEALYPNPGFPIYESVINYIGAKAVPLALKQENDSVSIWTRFATSSRPRPAPHHQLAAEPDRRLLPAEDLRPIAEILREYPDVWVLSDEIYSKMIYEGSTLDHGRAGDARRTMLLDGFSKTYAMTGWRLGYGVMPEALAQKVAQLATNCNSCTATFIQRAGMEALTGPQDEARRMCDEFLKRRDHLVEGLNEIEGISCLLPRGRSTSSPTCGSWAVPRRTWPTSSWTSTGWRP